MGSVEPCRWWLVPWWTRSGNFSNAKVTHSPFAIIQPKQHMSHVFFPAHKGFVGTKQQVWSPYKRVMAYLIIEDCCSPLIAITSNSHVDTFSWLFISKRSHARLKCHFSSVSTTVFRFVLFCVAVVSIGHVWPA
jgi:hypothetical protein